MNGPSDRRGFLRGLVTLPLIGGGVTLIGQPTAAAVPVTDNLRRQYLNWLNFETFRTAQEIFGPNDAARGWGLQLDGPAYDWHRERDFWEPAGEAPSSRAAVVLSAVGCDWRRA